MEDNPVSSPSPADNLPGRVETQAESDLPLRTVRVYDQPEPKRGLSPLLVGVIVILIAIILALLFLPLIL
jgi:hypothetical protein